AEIRELVEVVAQVILSQPENDMADTSNIEFIQKYSPGRAAQIREKFKDSMGSSTYGGKSNSANYPVSTSGYGIATSNANSNLSPQEREQLDKEAREGEERRNLETRTMEGVQSLTTKALPKEEREKII